MTTSARYSRLYASHECLYVDACVPAAEAATYARKMKKISLPTVREDAIISLSPAESCASGATGKACVSGTRRCAAACARAARSAKRAQDARASGSRDIAARKPTARLREIVAQYRRCRGSACLLANDKSADHQTPMFILMLDIPFRFS